uniref:Reverse transcriptase Ty1/copia-type domain-containing protein n=1 Tax=Ascaris lumbricoides TaxID=6252 RepID=A0A9J2PE32_ASCLU
MGQKVSTFPAKPPDFPFFSLTFRLSDTMLIVDASPEVANLIRDCVLCSWPAGIQREYDESNGVLQLKLNGIPFARSCTREHSVQTKKMLCLILKTLRERGWELILSSDLSRTYDLSTLFFQMVPVHGYNGCHIMCLSLSALDKLQLVNAPDDAGRILMECVDDLYQKHTNAEDFFEVQMKGYLWSTATAEVGFRSRQLLLDIFHRFHELGYRYYGTANIKGTADCIFFISDSDDVGTREYCMLSLNASDRIRLIGAPDEVINVVGECLDRHWKRGVQDAKRRDGGAYFEYKLKGFPWHTWGTESVDSQLVLTIILQQLITVGWAVVTALDVSRRPTDKAVFLLRRCAIASVPHFAICPAEADKVRVINADKEINELVGNVLRDSWTLGIQREGLFGSSYEYKLVGYAWSASSYNKQFELCRMMMSRLLYQLAQRGWRVICSADVSARYTSSDDHGSEEHPLDVHSWFVAHTGHAPASPPMQVLPSASGHVMPSVPPEEPPPSYESVMAGVGVMPIQKN